MTQQTQSHHASYRSTTALHRLCFVSLPERPTTLMQPPMTHQTQSHHVHTHRLVSINTTSRTADILVEPDFPLPDSALFNQTCADGRGGVCGEIKMIYWDPQSRLIIQGQQMGSPIRSATCGAATPEGETPCTVSIESPINWPPPIGSLVTLSPRVGASRYPIPSYYKGTLFVFNSSGVVMQDIDT
jgi:hypothetical protein